MALTKASSLAGGTYLKPDDYGDAAALLFEPKRVDRDVTYTKYGTTETAARDECVANLYVFRNQDQVDGKAEPDLIKDIRVVHGMVVKSLEKIVGEATIGILRKVPTQRGTGWALRDTDDATYLAVSSWYEKLEAEKAAALADMPDF